MARRRKKQAMTRIYALGQRTSQMRVEMEQRDGKKGNQRAFSISPADPLKSSSWPFEMGHNVKSRLQLYLGELLLRPSPKRRYRRSRRGFGGRLRLCIAGRESLLRSRNNLIGIVESGDKISRYDEATIVVSGGRKKGPTT